MLAAYTANLESVLSEPRLRRYRDPGASELDMVVHYYWNIELSEALYPGFALLEVMLRNAIHQALADREGTEMWFSAILSKGQLEAYNDADSKLRRRLKRAPSPGQIVAELSFGFWTSLLDQDFNQTLWAPRNAELLHDVFPYLPPTPNARRFIYSRYGQLRVLRNRVMHHEPVWRGLYWGQEQKSIGVLWTELVETISWTSPGLRDELLRFDRFEDVHENGRARIGAAIKGQLGIP